MATKTQHKDYLQSDHWKETRLLAIEEAGSQCERCQLPRWLAEIAYDQDLHVHHRHYRTKGRETSEDLEVLCRRCHDLETFKRTELREPKRAHCDICGDVHWDYRSSECAPCLRTMGVVGITPYDRANPADGVNAIWQTVLNEILWRSLRRNGSVDEVEAHVKAYMLAQGNSHLEFMRQLASDEVPF